ncbi:MAG: hypothetical protein RMJ98_00505 [Myxococcales bacterium]|nr:hypothetical protein [Polyangiaceae bacterium]MDW8247767.1 hypothetical protein [Myxococcales bacterium]
MNKLARPRPEFRGPRPSAARRSAVPSPRHASSAAELLDALFEAERTVRRLHKELGRSDRTAVLTAIASAIIGALQERDEREATVRLVSCAQVLAQFTGDQTVDLLIDILGSEIAEAHQVAGEVLSEFALSRFKEVALGVERALQRLPQDHAARLELPFLLQEIPEPGVVKLLQLFLQQQDPQALLAALEACVERGDPELLPAIEALRSDRRIVELGDEEGETEQAELGQLATEACDLIREGA